MTFLNSKLNNIDHHNKTIKYIVNEQKILQRLKYIYIITYIFDTAIKKS